MAEQSNQKETSKAIEVLETTALVATIRGEIDGQVATAKAYPRSLAEFMKRAEALVGFNEDMAAACFYSVPRAGKKIEGSSIRMAEVVANTYGHLRYAGFIVEERAEEIIARGTCHDVESNVACSADVSRRIVDKAGNRFNRDMIIVTGNAAISIAIRNAILRIVPKPLVDQLLELAMMTARGKAETLTARVEKAIAFFASKGIDEKRVLNALGKAGRADITLDDMVTMSGLKTALKDGEISVDELFPAVTVKSPVFAKKSEKKEEAKAEEPKDVPPPSKVRTNPDGSVVDESEVPS